VSSVLSEPFKVSLTSVRRTLADYTMEHIQPLSWAFAIAAASSAAICTEDVLVDVLVRGDAAQCRQLRELRVYQYVNYQPGSCIDCTISNYQPVPASISSLKCPGGRYTAATGTALLADCEDCLAGTCPGPVVSCTRHLESSTSICLGMQVRRQRA